MPVPRINRLIRLDIVAVCFPENNSALQETCFGTWPLQYNYYLLLLQVPDELFNWHLVLADEPSGHLQGQREVLQLLGKGCGLFPKGTEFTMAA